VEGFFFLAFFGSFLGNAKKNERQTEVGFQIEAQICELKNVNKHIVRKTASHETSSYKKARFSLRIGLV
jgi:hypothetical protein